ncbi:hypothetical protein [Pseudomonas sp. nanlin1]|uniref:hypothetical protein n=1 Tax=Pseudomonas sp. nanlin1 TaxID=3040605 RepID=UPI003890EF27
MPSRLVALLFLLGTLASATQAAPAPWYKWQSLTKAGVYLCAQTSPGEGWARLAGPYDNAGCRAR